ncbi:hypothetical protein BWQ96_06397 [Gracilariopsis chorda]|uniref:Uncharacterized protein n=1 Tax=Gracilariopsis chorda TaxID=448386 RepID=A0A2V3IP36_9FLOR|nr:hypothetical protein BWQ96_06397 [Gracilariopsis chorda]|eukprot:PXF43851.1 hypothetical protein BWQ96_06397 [Gracilariopsis chorda]
MEKDVIQAALAVARSSLMEERTRAKKKDDAVLRAEQLAKESRQLLQEEKALREEKDNLLSLKAAVLEGALRKANDYLSDRQAIKSTYRAEVQRTETWEHAKLIMEEGKRFIAAESRAYAQLKKIVEEGKFKFSDRTEYNPSRPRARVHKRYLHEFSCVMKVVECIHLGCENHPTVATTWDTKCELDPNVLYKRRKKTRYLA